MILVTVGTQFAFDRLVRAVDAAVGAGVVCDEVFAQIAGGWRPVNMAWVDFMDSEEFSAKVAEASAIIGHAGIGTILAALEAYKPTLVMPRMKRYGEVVNDHQVATAREFAARGYLLAASGAEEMPEMIKALLEFTPEKRTGGDAAIVARVKSFLEAVSMAGQAGPDRCLPRDSMDQT